MRDRSARSPYWADASARARSGRAGARNVHKHPVLEERRLHGRVKSARPLDLREHPTRDRLGVLVERARRGCAWFSRDGWPQGCADVVELHGLRRQRRNRDVLGARCQRHDGIGVARTKHRRARERVGGRVSPQSFLVFARRVAVRINRPKRIPARIGRRGHHRAERAKARHDTGERQRARAGGRGGLEDAIFGDVGHSDLSCRSGSTAPQPRTTARRRRC